MILSSKNNSKFKIGKNEKKTHFKKNGKSRASVKKARTRTKNINGSACVNNNRKNHLRRLDKEKKYIFPFDCFEKFLKCFCK